MRNNLIMHFHCAECGTVLELVHPAQAAAPKPYLSSAAYIDGHTPEPTGAAVCYVSPVFVAACKACITKHTGPAIALAKAISAFSEIKA